MDIRSLEDEQDRRSAFALFRQAMIGIGDIGRSSPETEARLLAGGKLLGGFEGGLLRGVVNGYDSAITVPGGARLSHLSVTHVGVSSEATRRGIARSLLVEQLHRARKDGYVVAGLRASDTRIYGRYGYGVASWSARHVLDLTQTGLALPPIRDGLRAVDAIESFPLFRRIAETDPAPRPASLSRWDGWWSLQDYRVAQGATPQHAVVFGAEGHERGFLRFHAEASDNWFTSPCRTAIVDDIVAHDDEAWRALIGHLFNLDILDRVVFASRPVDDPLPLLLTNPRALEIAGQRDESWIRPLDLSALLSARRFGDAPQVDIMVEDALFPDQHGVWSVGAEGATRSRQAAQAHIAVADLATLIFGGKTARQLAAAGRLQVDSPRVLSDLQAMFQTDRLPHAGVIF